MSQTRSKTHCEFTGFTLVEMLVAVTLVLIMMTMFAQIFQIAGASISKQRGLAENDQRSRTLQTIIKADLDKRTLRWVYPFAANEDVSSPESYIGKRQGFFYISENDPYNKTDDVLHFTVASTITARNKDQSPYYGKALQFPSTDNASPNPNLDLTTNPFIKFPNQPDADDAYSVPNNTGLSTVAEIIYFVRNGNLYRRQLLVRQPLSLPSIGSRPQPDTSNTNSNVSGTDLFVLSTAPGYPYLLANGYATTFWNDFDYSAYYSGTGATFLGSNSLDNSISIANSIANPPARYGHDSFTGNPKEYLFYSATPSSTFIGAYTFEECSNVQFQYPQSLSGGANPMDPAFPGTPGTDTDSDGFNQFELNGDGVLDNWRGGPRRGEDLLLSNVHSFDVQVWDGRAAAFVNMGDTILNTADLTTGGPSDYAPASRFNTGYGPNSTVAINAVFDSWHPKVDLNSDGTFEDPPLHPVILKPQSAGGTIPAWQSNQPYIAGKSIVFPTSTNLPNGWPFYYICIQSGTSDNSLPTAKEPTWPKIDSVKVNDNSVVWQAVDNRKPLKAIKIEVRFIDPSTQQMRQLTMIQSLVD